MHRSRQTYDWFSIEKLIYNVTEKIWKNLSFNITFFICFRWFYMIQMISYPSINQIGYVLSNAYSISFCYRYGISIPIDRILWLYKWKYIITNIEKFTWKNEFQKYFNWNLEYHQSVVSFLTLGTQIKSISIKYLTKSFYAVRSSFLVIC